MPAVTQKELLSSGQCANVWASEILVTMPTPRRVTVPLFEISSNPQIPFSEIRERRFNLIDREIDKIDNELALIKRRKEIKQERKLRKEFRIKYRGEQDGG